MRPILFMFLYKPNASYVSMSGLNEREGSYPFIAYVLYLKKIFISSGLPDV